MNTIKPDNRANNFDFLRLLFASLVVFSHAFALTDTSPEILSKYSYGQLSFGGLAVDVFFIISGFLIISSLKQSKSIKNYLWKRCLRLFPALFFMLIFSCIVISIVYTGNNIFREKDFYKYFFDNMTLYKVRYSIPHVFENNPYPSAINGSLWSLSYEFTMYIVLLLAYKFKENKKILLTFLISAYLLAVYGQFNTAMLKTFFSEIHLDTSQLYRLASLFLAGSILRIIDIKALNRLSIKLVIFFLIIVTIQFRVYNYFSIILTPTLIILIGLSYSATLNYIPSKIGDLSYGIYIYGFLIQQLFMNYLDLNPYLLTLYSLIVTYILSYISWHLIEKKCLRFKNRF
ncbi:acyltransferase [Sphingobacterium psychroaquaticum]|uniref:acyltransferase family protein n=1 Tax=Sphingobacterium psychroaquaticum TaxID=561061 RepID=UPI00106A5AE9|nr:acyltransferase [Sphingobacterium psychroaquaticum]QBQ42230.1 acyltransferase [Sphingobacterium psychroaquaticum]